MADHVHRNTHRGARKQAEACLDAVKAQHPQLAGAFGTGAGLRLQRADADIAEAIITRLMNRGVSILPIHDSFVIAQQYEGILREAMEAAWRDFLGTDP